MDRNRKKRLFSDKEIIIVRFYDNRKNPDKLPNILNESDL